ncbi:unnamed protein product [Leptidea sinapis]|uniref:FLYWCH-type domain-containing protein n=1 Tax=Leptidea sinapis TaxID=189913 RepID=A0A5E4PX78_9NEOP|nr:unnamed protein product [Leptidea sinapis]
MNGFLPTVELIRTTDNQIYLRYKGYCYSKQKNSSSRWRCTKSSSCYVAMHVDPSNFEVLSEPKEHQHPPKTYFKTRDVELIRTTENQIYLRYKGYCYSKRKNSNSRWRCTKSSSCYVGMHVDPSNFKVLSKFVWTKRGGKHPLLLVNGYTYSYQKRNVDGRVSWYCSRRLKGCRASATSLSGRVLTCKPHDHAPPHLVNYIEKTVDTNHLFEGFEYLM